MPAPAPAATRCLSIHLTDLCNSACSFCVVGSPLYTQNTVAYEDVERFLLENVGSGYDVVNLHGGEPSVHPRFEETLETIQRLGYSESHIQTNAIRFGDERLVERCVELGVRKFIISLHGSTAAIHDGQTCSRGFEKTIDAFRHIKARGIPIRTNTVITKQNLTDLLAITELACELGVDHLNFSNLHPVGSARLSRGMMMPSISEILPELRPAVEFALGQGRAVTLEGFPYCVGFGDGFERLHLHNEYRAIRLMIRGIVLDSYDDFMRDEMRVFGEPCQTCSVRDICGGLYPEYAEYYGWEEISPLSVDPDELTADRSAHA